MRERHDVRQSAQRNTFTGKTYNSLENISQFFGERGMPFNAAACRGPRSLPGRPFRTRRAKPRRPPAAAQPRAPA